MMKKGDTLELTIESYAFEGKGVAKIAAPEGGSEKRFVVFVDRSYPGDRVLATIIKKRSSYAEAKIEKIIVPSKERTEPRCAHFGVCGGCKQQDLGYRHQLNYKRLQVEELFNKIGGLTDFTLEEIIPSEKIYFYRNKMEFSFAQKRWLTEEEINSAGNIHDREFALGLHIPKYYDKVLNVKECFLQSELSNMILSFTRDFFKEREISVYSTATHTGYLRNLVVRQSARTNDLMINLVTSEDNPDLMSLYTGELIKNFGSVTTVINNVNLKKAQIAVGDFEKTYFGPGYIFDMIGKYKFRISANSFFQTNTGQAEKLYSAALDYAALKGDETVYDLYSGAGTIAAFISGKAKRVYAFESVEDAIIDAHENSIINGIENIKFIRADLNHSFLPELKKENIPAPDVIILDPPRSGVNPKIIEDLIEIKPPKIVYISCNPSTQARDIKLLCANDFRLIKIKPVDMFPQTYHIENVALLELKSGLE